MGGYGTVAAAPAGRRPLPPVIRGLIGTTVALLFFVLVVAGRREGGGSPSSLFSAEAAPYDAADPLGEAPMGYASGAGVAWEALRGALSRDARVVAPEDADFAETCVARNPARQGVPAGVVQVKSVEDVVAATAFARQNRLRVTVFSTGHDYDGKSTGDASLTLDMSAMRWVDVDAESGTARVGPATRWLEVFETAKDYGLVPVSGYDSSVGVSGFIMGGGHGALSRTYGLGCDQVLGATIVLADGSVKELTAHSEGDDGDLFWALRGGGGGTFGTVVSWTLKLHPSPPQVFQLTGHVALADDDGALVRDLLTRFVHNASWWDDLDRGWSGWPSLNRAKAPTAVDAEEGLDVPQANFEMLFIYAGDDADPLREGTAMRAIVDAAPEGSTTLDHLASLLEFEEHLGSIRNGNGVRQFIGNIFPSKSDLAAGGGKRLADFVVDQVLRDDTDRPFVVWYNTVLGGAVRDHSSAVSPGFRDAVIELGPNVYWYGEEHDAEASAFGAQFSKELNTYASSSYFNEWSAPNAEDDVFADWRERFFGENYDRLNAVKRAVDPCNVFWVHHGIGSDVLAFDEHNGCAP